MINLGEMILSGPVIRTGAAKANSTKREERLRAVLETIEDNTTSVALGTMLGIHSVTAMQYLRELERQGHLLSWKVGQTLWFSLSPAELKRRKS